MTPLTGTLLALTRGSCMRTRALAWPLFAALIASAGGCTSTKLTRVARYEPGRTPAEVRLPAPVSAAYRVKYADASGDGLRTLGGTQRIVGRGDTLGFVRAADGTLVAVAGDERIPLDKLPESARYCVWIAN